MHENADAKKSLTASHIDQRSQYCPNCLSYQSQPTTSWVPKLASQEAVSYDWYDKHSAVQDRDKDDNNDIMTTQW